MDKEKIKAKAKELAEQALIGASHGLKWGAICAGISIGVALATARR